MKTKIYTKIGDKGKTAVIGGSLVPKSDSRLDAYGSIDELNAALGLVLAEIDPEKHTEKFFAGLSEILGSTQNYLFNVGSHLACVDDEIRKKLPHVDSEHIRALEKSIDTIQESLPELKEFILPGGSRIGAHLHLARTICRRAERMIVKFYDSQETHDPLILEYINRLGDYLFAAARGANHASGSPEVKWKKS